MSEGRIVVPSPHVPGLGQQQMPVQMAVLGLTLRDYFAVMCSGVVGEYYAAPGVELKDIAQGAYEFADLMLKAREGKL